MGRYLLKKKIFTALVLIALLAFSVYNFMSGHINIEYAADEYREANPAAAPDEMIDVLETAITQNIACRMNFIEGFSYVQKLLDKHEVNNFTAIKDESGSLQYASFYREMDTGIFEYALRLKRLRDAVETNGTKVLFVVTPSKYMEGSTVLRRGLPINDPSPIVDCALFYLNRLGIETLDLRKYFPNDEISYEESFFRTDHHWTVPSAFYATNILVDTINERFGQNFDPNDYYTNRDTYTEYTYKNKMLGSLGRKTGAVFSSVEDFTALWPEFTGSFQRDYTLKGMDELLHKSGTFQEAIMDVRALTEDVDIYSKSPWSLYLTGLSQYEKIVNNDNANGPSIFFIRDSYFSPVVAFMIPMCSEISSIWSLEAEETIDIESCVLNNKFDYIIMEIYPYNIEDAAFNFFKEEH